MNRLLASKDLPPPKCPRDASVDVPTDRKMGGTKSISPRTASWIFAPKETSCPIGRGPDQQLTSTLPAASRVGIAKNVLLGPKQI